MTWEERMADRARTRREAEPEPASYRIEPSPWLCELLDAKKPLPEDWAPVACACVGGSPYCNCQMNWLKFERQHGRFE